MKMQSFELPIPAAFGRLCAAPAAVRDKVRQHDAAHALLQSLLSRNGIENPALVFGEYEKPYFSAYPEIFFNLSHCDGLAVCLFSDAECGVDAEQIRHVRPAVVRKVFSDGEQAALAEADCPDVFFTRLWTLKEAFTKAVGRGISYPMHTVEFRIQGQEILSNQKNASFAQILLPGHIVSVCVFKYTGIQPITAFSLPPHLGDDKG